MIERLCHHCGQQISRPLYKSMVHKVKFCDRACRAKHEEAVAQARTYRLHSEGTKKCTRCKVIQPKDHYFSDKRKGDGLFSWCRMCCSKDKAAYRKENRQKMKELDVIYQLRHKYGMSLEEYEELGASQGGVCAICGDTPVTCPHGKLYVDHCHETGVRRGLLCQRCNSGIGLLDESPSLLRAAANYIERHEKAGLQGAILKLAEEDR